MSIISFNIVKQTDTGKGRVMLYEEGFMHQVYNDSVDLNIKDSLREMEIYRSEFCNEGKRPILVDITNLKSVSKESRGIYASENTASVLIRAALLVGNPVSRIIGNFYLGLNKSKMPVKMFSDVGEAVEWLKQALYKK